ncbi:MAG TPA: hypothetical protein VGB24_12285 [Longimicrobium sp.]|jgi:predicted metalloprotease with PDZ domain|uniref:M61 family metallopeptidase n=1 Tax=Longimicrobium sp. TaxID=2029185 RepID=UPI002EDB8BD3
MMALLLGLALPAQLPAIEYQLEVVDDSTIEVRVSFEPRGRESTLSISAEWDGHANLGAGISSLRVDPGAADVQRSMDGARVRIAAPPGQRVHLTYRLKSTAAGTPGEGMGRPLITPEYTFLLANTALLVPDWGDTTTIRASVQWGRRPAAWVADGSLGPDGTGTLTIAELRAALFISGDWSLTPAAGGGVMVATRSLWTFPVERWANLVSRITAVQTATWGQPAADRVLAVVLPLPAGSNQGGEGRTRAVVAYAPVTIDGPEAAAHSLAHEMFHGWLPGRTGGSEELYWFTEGVTDFYAALSLLRTGVVDWEGFVSRLNEVLRSYSTSPDRELSVAAALAARAERQSAQRLPYEQGYLLAASWYGQGGRPRGALDRALRQLAFGGPAAALTRERIVAALVEAGIHTGEADVRRVFQGRTITLPAGVFGGCAVERRLTVKIFDAGFDVRESFAQDRVTGLVAGSAAARAGLRNGQRVLGGGMVADPDAPAELVVDRGHGPDTIRYFPARSIPGVPQFEPAGRTCPGWEDTRPPGPPDERRLPPRQGSSLACAEPGPPGLRSPAPPRARRRSPAWPRPRGCSGPGQAMESRIRTGGCLGSGTRPRS